METLTFAERAYALCRTVPAGKVTTYKEMARALGTKGYQAIGQALRCNPYAPKVPCHRVVKSDGSLGGFKGKKSGGEIEEKIMLLEKEGVMIVKGKIDLEKYTYTFLQKTLIDCSK